MTKQEAKLMVNFFEFASTYMSNAGCNDFTLPKTEENMQLMERAFNC